MTLDASGLKKRKAIRAAPPSQTKREPEREHAQRTHPATDVPWLLGQPAVRPACWSGNTAARQDPLFFLLPLSALRFIAISAAAAEALRRRGASAGHGPGRGPGPRYRGGSDRYRDRPSQQPPRKSSSGIDDCSITWARRPRAHGQDQGLRAPSRSSTRPLPISHPKRVGEAPNGGFGEYLAEGTAGESPEDAGDLDGADLADELRGRPAPPFRTPHSGHESS